jgi:hypothetical protein
MKICPKCQQTYTDENLNFCLNDGSTLTQAGYSSGGSDALPDTVMINQPRPTNPNQQFGSQQPPFQNSWSTPPPQQPQFSMQPQPSQGSSKTWLWAVGILGLVVLLCGGGLVGFFVLVANKSDNPVNYNNSATPTVTPSTSFKTVDMSPWRTGTDEYAITQYSGGVYTMETIKDSVYYVLVAPAENKTQNKITKLTVKNIDGASVRYGYGLLIHSYTTPLIGDYAFLIDSNRKRYRVVQHSLKTEKEIVKWTSSNAIKGGSDENVLEVRDKDDKMQFYINGQYVTTVDDTNNVTDGVAGIYSSDGIPIGFSKLEIEK